MRIIELQDDGRPTMSRAGLARLASDRRKMLPGSQATLRLPCVSWGALRDPPALARLRRYGARRSGRDHFRDSAAAAVNTLRAITDRSESARAV
jgi:hypothetical protein